MPCLSVKMSAKNVMHRNIRHSWQKASYLEQAQRGSFAGKRTISLMVILVKRGCCGNIAGATPVSSTGTFSISEETQADCRVPFCPPDSISNCHRGKAPRLAAPNPACTTLLHLQEMDTGGPCKPLGAWNLSLLLPISLKQLFL